MADTATPVQPRGPTVRGLIGVVGAVVMYRAITELLELVLVASVGGVPPDDASYFATRNRPAILAAKLAYNTCGAVLSGYMAAKVAGERETPYGRMAALVQTAELAWRFTADDYAQFTPVWMRTFLVLTTGPAMLLGASIRARARVAQDAAVEMELRERA